MIKSTLMAMAILASPCLVPNECMAKITLENALARELVDVTAVSNGGYNTKGIHLTLKNKSMDMLEVDITPGMVFRPKDDQYQDLVLVGDESMILSPGVEQSLDLQTFCGRMAASSPKAGIDYDFLYQGDSAMRQTMSFIKDNKLYDDLGQHAIWSLTSGSPMSAIYDNSRPEFSKMFMRYVCDLTKSEVPEYYVEYNITHDALNRPVMNPKNAKVYVQIEWKGAISNRVLEVQILKADGSVYKSMQGSESINSEGEHIMNVVFDASKEPTGIYYVQMRDQDNKIYAKKKVKVGFI